MSSDRILKEVVSVGPRVWGPWTALPPRRIDVSSFAAFPSAPLGLLLASSFHAQEMWGRHSPATRLIDGEVKLPYVQH